MKKLSLAQCMRSAHISRWHMVRTFRTQTLAEHLALVQMVALEVLNRIKPDDKMLRLQVLEWALWHDMPEVVTGDIPTPFKMMLADKGVPSVIHEIERGIDSRFNDLSGSAFEITKIIVVFADLYEAIHFLHEEGLGVRSQAIEKKLQERMAIFIAQTREALLPELAEVFDDMVQDMWWDADE